MVHEGEPYFVYFEHHLDDVSVAGILGPEWLPVSNTVHCFDSKELAVQTYLKSSKMGHRAFGWPHGLCVLVSQCPCHIVLT